MPAVFGFKDENSAAEAQGAFTKLLRLSKATGTFVLGVMHPGKHKVSGDVRGSGVFEGSPDIILNTNIGKNGIGTLTVTKARASATQNASWGYNLVPLMLANGESLAYVSGVAKGASPTAPAMTERQRMTRDAADVLLALRNAARDHPITWVSPAGTPMSGADEEAIRLELNRIKPSSSADVKRRTDALRQTWTRGIKKLLAEAVIAKHERVDGPTVYWHIEDNLGRHE